MADIIDDCFALVDATLELEALELGAHQAAVDKLIQDAGVVIDRFYNGHDANKAAPGPETARLNAAFEDVTPQRIEHVLRAAHAAAPDSNKAVIVAVMKKIGITDSAVVAPPATDKPGLKR